MVALTTHHLISPASLPPYSPVPPIPIPGLAEAEAVTTATTNNNDNEYLSVLSYNVLLPNSVDGWWNYKMYLPPLFSSSSSSSTTTSNDDVVTDISSWDYRRNLLRERIGLIDADVVCFQEVSPLSFEEDFAFMKEDLGYDGCELFKKGRFRPATFWKTRKCDLVGAPVHKDRTLLTAFRVVSKKDDATGTATAEEKKEDKNSSKEDKKWYVLNCHLQAGSQGGRRVRQIHEGMRAVFTLAKKLKEKDPKSPNLIVCGDFNGGPECGAVKYIEEGFISPDFIEDGEPVTSKLKESPLSLPLLDAMNVPEIQRKDKNPPPPTLVVPELISLLVEIDESLSEEDRKTAYENPCLSKDAKERLERIYRRYATFSSSSSEQQTTDDATTMNISDVERWLIDINGRVGRGSEFRNAAKEMGWVEPVDVEDEALSDGESKGGGGAKKEKARIVLPQDGILSLEGFVNVYESELREGKFWGIAHDLAVMGEALPDAGVFESRYDRMYCSASLHPFAVLDTVSTVPCPNKSEPSDHLPIAASFVPR